VGPGTGAGPGLGPVAGPGPGPGADRVLLAQLVCKLALPQLTHTVTVAWRVRSLRQTVQLAQAVKEVKENNEGNRPMQPRTLARIQAKDLNTQHQPRTHQLKDPNSQKQANPSAKPVRSEAWPIA